MEQHPDRLVAFLDVAVQKIASSVAGDEGARAFIQQLVDEAVERNLTTGELRAPDVDLGDPAAVAALTAEQRAALQLHEWAFALTGAAANARKAVSQIGGADMVQRRHPGHVDELVARVADEVAREAS